MTIDEAKTKWCPFSMAGMSFNRLVKTPADESCPCIADKCMAWRKTKNTEDEGYCGLAGQE